VDSSLGLTSSEGEEEEDSELVEAGGVGLISSIANPAVVELESVEVTDVGSCFIGVVLCWGGKEGSLEGAAPVGVSVSSAWKAAKARSPRREEGGGRIGPVGEVDCRDGMGRGAEGAREADDGGGGIASGGSERESNGSALLLLLRGVAPSNVGRTECEGVLCSEGKKWWIGVEE
jgi:hypothetical protein